MEKNDNRTIQRKKRTQRDYTCSKNYYPEMGNFIFNCTSNPTQSNGEFMEFKVKGQELLNKIEELIREGNVRRIIIKDADGKTFIEIPLSVGVIGVIAAPIVAAVGALAGVVANFTVEVIKSDDSDSAEFTEVVEKESNKNDSNL